VLASEKIYFYDNMGVRQEIAQDEIWGFARNGVLYVRVQGAYNRITFFGSIIHFVADVTTTSPGNYPYNYYDPYYSPYRSYYSPYYYSPYRSYYDPYGYGYPYEALLMRDPELYEEFVSMRNKNQKKMMFVYLRKFNERNPAMLPAGR